MRKSCFRCSFHIKGYLLVICGCVWMFLSLGIILLLSWRSLNEPWCFPQGFTPSLLDLLVSQLIPWKLLLISEGLELSGYVNWSIARFGQQLDLWMDPYISCHLWEGIDIYMKEFSYTLHWSLPTSSSSFSWLLALPSLAVWW